MNPREHEAAHRRPVPTVLPMLHDIDMTGLADGDTLTWDDTTKKWKPSAAAAGQFAHDLYTAAATPRTHYVLSFVPATGSCLVSKQGLVLREGTDYTVNYSTGLVTITASQSSGDQIVARYATDGTTSSPVSDTITIQTGTDDASSASGPAFSGGDFQNTDAILASGYFFYAYQSSLRFSSIPDLTGATILSAVLRVTLASGNDAGANTKISADKSASPTAATSRASMTGKTRTTANVAWVSPSGTSGTADSPDFAPAIQELVDTFGTITAIQILHEATGTDNSHEMLYKSYDGSPAAAPKLILSYIT